MSSSKQINKYDLNKTLTNKEQGQLLQSRKIEATIWHKVRLNTLGLLLIALYSTAIVSVGVFYGVKLSTNQDKKHLISIIQTLESKIDNIEYLANRKNIKTEGLHKSNPTTTREFEKMITRTLLKKRKYDKKNTELLNLRNREIADLKLQLRNTDTFKNVLKSANDDKFRDLSRAPSSLNQGNVNVLRYEQKIKLGYLKDKQQEQLKSFLSYVDLTEPQNQKRYQNLLDSQNLEYYKLKDEYTKQRYQVIRNQRK